MRATARIRIPAILLLLFAGSLLSFKAHAQLAFGMNVPRQQYYRFLPADTMAKDTIRKPNGKNPKTAAILSLCLPGAGQVYNGRKSYWKVPVIYAGFAGLGVGFGFNQKYYKLYRDALRMRYDDDSTTIDGFQGYSDDDLVTLKNYYQRYRDLCVIGAAALYTLQVIDAVVDAHLSSFDVSDDLSMQIQPSVFPTSQGMTATIGLRFTFR